MHVVQRCSWWMTIVWLVAALSNVRTAMVSRFPLNFRHNHKMAFKIFYQIGNSEPDLPECSEMVVCNILDTYSTPWIERQCRCPNKRVCSMSADSRDGYTIVDKNRQLKLCEPVNRLPTCRYFRDVAWTYTTYPDNTTKQTMHCACPKNSVAYIFKNEAFSTEDGIGGLYFLACSPQSKMRCQRKEPCRLFTVKKGQMLKKSALALSANVRKIITVLNITANPLSSSPHQVLRNSIFGLTVVTVRRTTCERRNTAFISDIMNICE